MTYHYSRKISLSFEDTMTKVTEALQRQGFGIITSIDLKTTLKQKLNVDFRNYRILGACNPQFAHKAVSLEPYIGVMLPCNVVVQEHEDGKVEVSAINPMETMDKGLSPELSEIATEVSSRLRQAIDDL